MTDVAQRRVASSWPSRGHAAALAVAAVCWGAFAFGAAYPWAYWPLAWSLCRGRRGRSPLGRRRAGRPDRALVGGLALRCRRRSSLQLVPLPLAWLGALSPRTLPLLENSTSQYGAV